MSLIRKQAAAALFLCVAAMCGVACKSDPAAKEAKFLARGKSFLEAKDYPRAVLQFSNAARINPKRADTWHQLALAYLGSRQTKQAVEALRRALSIDPNHTAAQLRLSELMVTASDPSILEDAVKRLDKILATDSNQADALDLLAIAELKLNRPEDAVHHLEQALDRFPGRLRSSAALAAVQFSKRDYAAAEKTLRSATAADPKSADAAIALAQLYALENKTGDAEAELRRAISVDASSTAAWMALAALQTSQGKMDEAEQSYQKVASFPKSDFRHAHAAFLLRRGRNDDAIREFQKLAADEPSDRAARLRLLAAYVKVGRPSDALALIAETLKKNPKNSDALLIRSQMNLRQGKPEDAEADLQQVLHFNPGSADAHYGLSQVYAQTGRQRMRQKELSEVVRLRPDLLAARAELARAQVAAGHADVALQTIEAAPARQKTTVGFTIERNWVLLALNRLDDASAGVNAALSAVRAPNLVLQRGIIKQMRKDYAGAAQDAQAALRESPRDSGALLLLMNAYLARHENAKAIEAARAAVRDAADPAMMVFAGEWLERLGKADEARGAFAAAAARQPGFLPAEMASALIDLREGKANEAKTRLLAVIAKDPQNDSALLLLGNIEYAAKNYAAALSYFRPVADRRPESVVALNATAYLLAMGDPNQGLKYAEAALELAPDDAMVQDTAGWVYYRKGMYEKAVGYLEAAVAKQASPLREYHLGMAYLKSGDRARGSKLLNAALAKDPNLMKTEQGW